MPSNRVIDRIHGLVCAATILAGFGTAQASAQTADDRTFFTFSGPVELPGVALAPGTYMFRLLLPDVDHGVVQVASADGKEMYGTFFTLPVQRATPPNNSEVRLTEPEAAAPAAIKAWWYLGDSTGFEFIYPRAQAVRGAMIPGESVRASEAQTSRTAVEPVNDN
jgi:hypothetical protein